MNNFEILSKMEEIQRIILSSTFFFMGISTFFTNPVISLSFFYSSYKQLQLE